MYKRQLAAAACCFARADVMIERMDFTVQLMRISQ